MVLALFLLLLVTLGSASYVFTYQPTDGTDPETEKAFGIAANPPVYPGSRMNHGLVADGDGLAWLFGGVNSASVGFTDFWNYDPKTAIWSVPAPPVLPRARIDFGFVFLEASNRLRIFGGSCCGMLTLFYQDVWDYSIASNEWTFRSVAPGSDTWDWVANDEVTTAPFYPKSRAMGPIWTLGDDIFTTAGAITSGFMMLPTSYEYMWHFHDLTSSWTFSRHTCDAAIHASYFSDFPCHWSGLDGSFYGFGGELFRYSLVTECWETLYVPPGSTQETTTVPYYPGDRKGAPSFVIREGNQFDTENYVEKFLLFGGLGAGFYANLWNVDFDNLANPFELVPLTSTGNEIPAGAAGEWAGSDPYPRSRQHAQAVMTSDGYVVLYGGFTIVTLIDVFADVWVMEATCYARGECVCFTKPQTDIDVCDGNGECRGVDFCDCDDPAYWGDCTCLKSAGNCSDRGTCVSGACACFDDSKYRGSECSVPVCSDLINPEACGSFGTCTAPAVCTCDPSYWGSDCSCLKSLVPEGCSGHGHCSSGNCSCDTGYRSVVVGADCSLPVCYGLTNPEGACGLGECILAGVCDCPDGYFGNCEPVCLGSCSDHGTCISPGTCDCDDGFIGVDCGQETGPGVNGTNPGNSSIVLIASLVSVFSVLGAIGVVVISVVAGVCCYRARQSKTQQATAIELAKTPTLITPVTKPGVANASATTPDPETGSGGEKEKSTETSEEEEEDSGEYEVDEEEEGEFEVVYVDENGDSIEEGSIEEEPTCCIPDCTLTGTFVRCRLEDCDLQFHKRHTQKIETKTFRRTHCPKHEHLSTWSHSSASSLPSPDSSLPLSLRMSKNPQTLDEWLSSAEQIDLSLLREWNEVEVDEVIGKGGFSTVYSGFMGRERVAIKEVLVYSKKAFSLAQRELVLISACSVGTVIQLYGFSLKLGQGPLKMRILMELMDQDLSSYVDCESEIGSSLLIPQKFELLKQCCSAVEYIHSQNILHRDLKGSNFLVGGELDPIGVNYAPVVKLSDFGVSKMKSSDATQSMMSSMTGTPYWMAPEVLFGLDKTSYGFSADIYSLAFTFYEVMYGCVPYQSVNDPLRTIITPINFIMYVTQGSRPSMLSLDRVCPEMAGLIARLWKRPRDEEFATMKAVCDWFEENEGLFQDKYRRTVFCDTVVECDADQESSDDGMDML